MALRLFPWKTFLRELKKNGFEVTSSETENTLMLKIGNEPVVITKRDYYPEYILTEILAKYTGHSLYALPLFDRVYKVTPHSQ